MRKRPPIGPVLIAAARLRCPCCRRGRVFRGWPNRVWRYCPVCGLPFIRESGYYIGGMVLTYVFTTLLLVGAFLVSLLLPFRSGLSDNVLLWSAAALVLVLLLVRPSYSLWLATDYWITPWPCSETGKQTEAAASEQRPPTPNP